MPYKGVSVTDDRRVVTYRLGRRIAIAGDLREPITLARSSRSTDSPDETGFLQTLTPYRDAFAAVQQGDKRPLEGVSTDETAITTFWIRYDPSLIIEARDVISYGNDLYRVIATKVVGKLKDYITITAEYSARMDSERFATGVKRERYSLIPAARAYSTIANKFQ